MLSSRLCLLTRTSTALSQSVSQSVSRSIQSVNQSSQSIQSIQSVSQSVQSVSPVQLVNQRSHQIHSPPGRAWLAGLASPTRRQVSTSRDDDERRAIHSINQPTCSDSLTTHSPISLQGICTCTHQGITASASASSIGTVPT